MADIRLVNIRQLSGIGAFDKPVAGEAMALVVSLKDAYLDVRNGRIEGFGKMSDAPETDLPTYDVKGRMVFPGFIDCHTHLVYANDRSGEFVDRIKGLSYQEIAEKGGGILNSAAALNSMSEDELFEAAKQRLLRAISTGTVAIEIKSGYGLTVEGELKMLRVVKRLKDLDLIPIKATFLGAHAFPAEYKSNPEGYIDLIVNDMLPAIHEEGLAEYIDAFCEDGYFTVEQTERIVKAGAKYGLKARLHVNQFKSFGAVQMAASNDVLSLEHLEELSDEDLDTIKSSNMFAVGLPACSFFLGIPYTPVRKLIDANVPVALATDFNPGSSPTSNMGFVLSLGCIKMNLLPEEAFNACTINAAHALEIANEVGSFAIGKSANFLITDLPSLDALPYHFAENRIDEVWVNGEQVSY